MTTHNSTIVIERRTTKSGQYVMVVPVGKVAEGDTIRTVTRMCSRTPLGSDWVPTGRKDGMGADEYENVRTTTIARLGRPFAYRGYYIDEEDNLSITGRHEARRVPATEAQYAYPA